MCGSLLAQDAQIPEKLRKEMDSIDAAPFQAAPKIRLYATPSVGLIDVGLTQEKFQRMMELVLRRNGIEVYPYFQPQDGSGGLWITALVRPSTPGRYAWSVEFRYSEDVIPIRQIVAGVKGNSTRVEGVLWHRSEFGEESKTQVVRAVSDIAEDLADQFAVAYLRANPKSAK